MAMQTLDVCITIFFNTRKFIAEKTNFSSTEGLRANQAEYFFNILCLTKLYKAVKKASPNVK
jgi:hypothetical protein